VSNDIYINPQRFPGPPAFSARGARVLVFSGSVAALDQRPWSNSEQAARRCHPRKLRGQ